MDTSHLIDPITDRLPSGTAIVSAVTDVTSALADQISAQVGDLDLGDTARRARRTVAGVVPWMSVSRSSRVTTRRWLMAGVAATVIITVAVVLRRRSGTTESPARGDSTAGSTNGTRSNTRSTTAQPEREAAGARA